MRVCDIVHIARIHDFDCSIHLEHVHYYERLPLWTVYIQLTKTKIIKNEFLDSDIAMTANITPKAQKNVHFPKAKKQDHERITYSS